MTNYSLKILIFTHLQIHYFPIIQKLNVLSNNSSSLNIPKILIDTFTAQGLQANEAIFRSIEWNLGEIFQETCWNIRQTRHLPVTPPSSLPVIFILGLSSCSQTICQSIGSYLIDKETVLHLRISFNVHVFYSYDFFFSHAGLPCETLIPTEYVRNTWGV